MKKSVAKKEYLEVTYNEKIAPRTDYPNKLAKYLFENFINKPGTLLDVGCGRGEFLSAFQNLGCQVEGIDISPTISSLEIDFPIKQCDFENNPLPYDDNSFDYVFSKSVVEHLRYPENMLDECYRVLKPGGKIIIMCPSWVHTYWGPFYIDHTHVTPFTLPSLQQILLLSGFKVLNGMHFIQLPIVWRFGFVKILCELVRLLPLPFRPLYNARWPEAVNKFIRFSNEKMLLVIGEKTAK